MKSNLQLVIVMLSGLMMVACLKQKDETASGPKANITLVNAALDSKPITLMLDDEKVNSTPIPFGAVSGTIENAYLPARPGVRVTFLQVGENTAQTEKFLPWDATGYYTVIQYDTSEKDLAPVLIVRDTPKPVDSIAKIRVINLVAGADSISVFLYNTQNDTFKVSNRQPYLGNGGSVNPEFVVGIKPGNYRLEMFDRQGVILQEEEISLFEKQLYSWILVGETGGTGEKQPRLLKVLQQP